jgi:hypothetical protein
MIAARMKKDRADEDSEKRRGLTLDSSGAQLPASGGILEINPL